jgi:hypothetical protein
MVAYLDMRRLPAGTSRGGLNPRLSTPYWGLESGGSGCV